MAPLSLENAAELNTVPSAPRVSTRSKLSHSQRVIASAEPLPAMSRRSSGENTAAWTPSTNPVSSAVAFPRSKSQTFTQPSPWGDASQRLLEENEGDPIIEAR